MSQQAKVRRMLEWLTFLPPLDKVARALVLDYFLSYGPVESAIWHLNDRDSLTCLAAYGPNDMNVGVSRPGNIWRNLSEAQLLALQTNSKKGTTWSDGGCDVVVNLFAQSILIGFLTLQFPQAVEYRDQISSELEDISMLISLYISLRTWESANHNGPTSNHRSPTPRNGNPDLTERQKVVLAGIVMKKTNNAIAGELGYSVSTIRHETMRIFEILGVSNRIEAATYATSLGLI